MNITRDMAKEVSDWARENENVRVAILTSTRANPNASVDALSDYDIELFVRDFQPFLEGDKWIETFGKILVREPYKPVQAGNLVWRLVMFEDAPRIDFTIQLATNITYFFFLRINQVSFGHNGSDRLISFEKFNKCCPMVFLVSCIDAILEVISANRQ